MAKRFSDRDIRPFDEFIEQLMEYCNEYSDMIKKADKKIKNGQKPSKNHLYKMRQKSMIIEKLGKQFRTRTIWMEKVY